MSESKFQSKLIKQYESEGWYVIKMITTSKNGIPDLLLLKPNEIKFIEVKAQNGKLSELQKYRVQELTEFGFDVSVEYNKNHIK